MMKEKGLTQQNLSDLLVDAGACASLNTIKSWFRKNPKNRHTPKLETMRIMAEIFGVTIDNLLSASPNGKFIATRVKTKNSENLANFIDTIDTESIINTTIRKNDATLNNLVRKVTTKNDKFNLAVENFRYKFCQNLPCETTFLSQSNLYQRLQTKTAHKFLELFNEFGNDKLLLPVIEKLEKIKKISE